MNPCEAADHAQCDPDRCFRAKMAYWRDHGAPGVHFQGGRKFFGGHQTIREAQGQIVAEAKAKGNDVVPYHSVYGPNGSV